MEQTFRMTLPNHFCMDQCLVFLQRSDKELLHKVKNRSVYKAIKIDKREILFKIEEKNEQFIITVINARLTRRIKQHIKQYVIYWFDLKRDLSPFYTLAATDQLLSDLVKRYAGLRLVGIPEFFVAITWAIIGQQINLSFAYTLKSRLIKHYGQRINWNGVDFWIFPTYECVAGLTVNELKEKQFSTRKAEYIINIAKQLVAGQLQIESLHQKPYEQVKQTLLQLRGVGPWTADYVIMHCFYEMNAFPIADVGLHQAIERQLVLDKRPTIYQIESMAKGWRGWEAYATFYLWRSLYD